MTNLYLIDVSDLVDITRSVTFIKRTIDCQFVIDQCRKSLLLTHGAAI